MLICGKPSARADAVGLPISGERCARPLSSRMRSSKFSTPRLRRVTPSSPDRRQLGLGQRARLALERDLLGAAPRRDRGQPLDQRLRAAASRGTTACRRRSRRSSSGRPAIAGCSRVQLPLAREHVEIVRDLLRVLVGVDAEVAEVAALPAERDVEVEAERHRRIGGAAQRRPRVAVDGLRATRPKTADRWRRSSCRRRSGRRAPDAVSGFIHGVRVHGRHGRLRSYEDYESDTTCVLRVVSLLEH